MTAPEGNSDYCDLMETIHDLTRRLEIQETLVREQGEELKRLQSGGAASRSVVGGNAEPATPAQPERTLDGCRHGCGGGRGVGLRPISEWRHCSGLG